MVTFAIVNARSAGTRARFAPISSIKLSDFIVVLAFASPKVLQPLAWR